MPSNTITLVPSATAGPDAPEEVLVTPGSEAETYWRGKGLVTAAELPPPEPEKKDDSDKVKGRGAR